MKPPIKCNSCGRQLVYGQGADERVTKAEGAVADVHGYFCGICAQELDENGLFPDEPGYTMPRRNINGYRYRRRL